MGLFKAAEKKDDKARKEVEALLLEGEQLKEVYSLITDFAAVTNWRLIFVNGQFTSSKKVITSVPWSKITSVHLAKGGFMVFTKKVGVSVGSKDYDIDLIDAENARELHDHILKRII